MTSIKTTSGYLEFDTDDWIENEGLIIRFIDAQIGLRHSQDYYGHTLRVTHDNLTEFIDELSLVLQKGERVFIDSVEDKGELCFTPKGDQTTIFLYDPTMEELDAATTKAVIGLVKTSKLHRFLKRAIGHLGSLPNSRDQ